MFWAADGDSVGFYRGILPFTELAHRGRACYFEEALPDFAHDGEFDVVTVSTEPQSDVVRQFNPNVYVLANAIPT